MANGTRRDLGAGVVGVIAGFMSGLFGIGGGTVIVPGLVFVMRFTQRYAHGTSLAAIVPIAAAGVAGFALDDKVDWPVAGLLVVGSTIGAQIGTRLIHRVSHRHLRIGFAVLLLITAVRLVLDSAEFLVPGRDALDPAAALGLAGLGFVAGVLAGLMGVGGGIVLVPGQILLFGIEDAVAKGTSLAVIIPTAVVGTATNVKRDNADLRTAMIVGVAGVITAFLASRIAVDLDPTVSGVLFGLLLSVVSLRLLLQREPVAEPVAP
jgi:uncharacterized membrane protein YfcA